VSEELLPEPSCVICSRPATCYPIRTGRSWFDGVWFLSWINSLQAMPRRYTIVEDWGAGFKYCVTCQHNSRVKMQQAHADIRAAHAQFNADQEAKLAALEHGALDQSLRADFDKMLRDMGLVGGSSQPKQLEPAQSNVRVMTVATQERTEV